jgi:ribose transport system permease protein
VKLKEKKLMPPANEENKKIKSGNYNKLVLVSKRIFKSYGIFLSLLLLIIIFSIMTQKFLTIGNISNIFIQTTNNGIPAMGEALVIITGGIDISVGAIMGAGSVIFTAISNTGIHPIVGVIAVLVAGLVFGAVNGLLVTKLKLSPFIVTLATMSGIKGIIALLTRGTIITASLKNPETFQVLGRGKLLGIPVSVILMFFIVIFFWFILSKTKYGTYLLAVGGNVNSSRIAGIGVEKVILLAYMISGLCSCFTGAIYASRMMSGQFSVGSGLELIIISGCVIGGVSLTGGRGKPIAVLAGVLILTIIVNVLNLLNVPWYYHLMVQGSVVWAIVFFEKILDKQKMERL